MPTEPLTYPLVEVESFLPSGWSLLGDDPGHWDEKAKAWKLTVLDGAGMDWELSVDAGAAAGQGRLQALRQAFDELHRRRLGTAPRRFRPASP